MNIVQGLIWFIVITLAVTFALPKILDALLFYFDGRGKQLNADLEIQERKLEIMKQQYALQQGRRRQQ